MNAWWKLFDNFLTIKGIIFFKDRISDIEDNKIRQNPLTFLKFPKVYTKKISKSQNIFSWNSIAQKMKEKLDKILPYEATAEFCQIFRSFLEQWCFKKKMFWDLLTVSR